MEPKTSIDLKLLVVGPPNVGKTCLIRQATDHKFPTTQKATLGVDFSMKPMPAMGASLYIWDIAGAEIGRKITRVYHDRASGALVVTSVDGMLEDRLTEVLLWKRELDGNVRLRGTDSPVPCYLVLQKADLKGADERCDPRWFLPEGAVFLEQFCTVHGFFGYTFVSALTGKGVEQLCERITAEMLVAHGCLEQLAGEASRTVTLAIRCTGIKRDDGDDIKKIGPCPCGT